jgi:hypothetical protein
MFFLRACLFQEMIVSNDLIATVSVDGRIRVFGRGLLLGGGNGIGTNGGQNVFATLFCGPAASATASSTSVTGVPLEADGDFTLKDVPSPAPPNPCTTPILLFQTTGGTHPWFAAGIEDLSYRKGGRVLSQLAPACSLFSAKRTLPSPSRTSRHPGTVNLQSAGDRQAGWFVCIAGIGEERDLDSRGALGAAYKAFLYGILRLRRERHMERYLFQIGAPEDFGTAYETLAHYYWWRDGADVRTGDQLAYFKHFYTSLEWWKLVPRFNDGAWDSFADTSRSLVSVRRTGHLCRLFLRQRDIDRHFELDGEPFHLFGPMVQSTKCAV